jgi:hypothetical protein
MTATLSTIRRAVLIVSFIGLSACSVADYDEPIKTFSATASSADKSLKDYNDLILTQVGKVRHDRAMAQPVAVRVAKKECGPDSTRCHIVVLQGPNDPNPLPLVPESNADDLLLLMQLIKDYAAGLQAIVEADTASRVETSVDAVNGDVLKIADAVDPKNKNKAFGNYATPVGEAVKWAFGAYIDSVKLDALRTATRNADPLIAQAVPIFEATVQQVGNSNRASLAEVVSVRNDAFRQSHSESALSSLVQAAQSYDAVLTAAPDTIFSRLSQSHSDLTKALNDRSVTWDKVFKDLSALQTDVNRFSDIIAGLLAASKGKGG